jgi:hypothetical protein
MFSYVILLKLFELDLQSLYIYCPSCSGDPKKSSGAFLGSKSIICCDLYKLFKEQPSLHVFSLVTEWQNKYRYTRYPAHCPSCSASYASVILHLRTNTVPYIPTHSVLIPYHSKKMSCFLSYNKS